MSLDRMIYSLFRGGKLSKASVSDLTADKAVTKNLRMDGTLNAGNVRVLAYDPSGNAMISVNNALPTGAGYSKGALLFFTGTASDSRSLFTNVGSAASCNFVPLGRLPVTKVTDDTDSNITVLVADLLKGYFVKTGTMTGGRNVTTDTAANIIAALPYKVGNSFDWVFVNSSNATMTLVGGTGVTLYGTSAITANSVSLVRFIVTGSSTIDAISIV